MGYGVIIADPPWAYRNAGVEGAAAAEYPTMTTAQLCALPVANLAAPDAVLLLWGTWPNLPDALAVLRAWSFEYVSGFPWIKFSTPPVRDLWGDWRARPQYGTGFWVRGCSEFVFIGRRGNVSPPDGGFVGLLSANFGHSRKPDNLHQYAEQFPGPYLEMFARRPRPGWAVWGNEVASTVEVA